MSFPKRICLFVGALCALTATAHAAFIVQVDTDGSNAGTAVTLNSHVTFGNGMTGGFGGSVHSTAVGLANGNSIFGGNAPAADQYIFTYTLGSDPDNYAPANGQALGNGFFASGAAGGASGLYNVFVCWPTTTNISDNGAVPTSYVTDNDGADVTTPVNQDEDTNGALVGGVWYQVATNVALTAGTAYTVTQTAPNSSFTSMRAEAVMWEPAPEPGSLSLLALALPMILKRRHA